MENPLCSHQLPLQLFSLCFLFSSLPSFLIPALVCKNYSSRDGTDLVEIYSLLVYAVAVLRCFPSNSQRLLIVHHALLPARLLDIEEGQRESYATALSPKACGGYSQELGAARSKIYFSAD